MTRRRARRQGGLIASGWHTCAPLSRMNCDEFLVRTATVDEAGVEEVRWQRPVRPGDRLHVRRHILAKRPSEGRMGEGEVEFLYEVVNQEGVVAMTQRSLVLLKQRSGSIGN
jgi:acyl dehydratase